ncbi:SipW-dependent-type signal peptide-containing protein [Microbacterium sp. RU33B]|uniref:SipW-dependent-type signal peptide-containing protein n=1 Tax=Microbacterium sp. RU33B TaxID=1907390 RepID=UPI0009759583|nr:SipW-dependent-type signal peptide-containing protein [Microbacterium sp. RU33B]
MSTEELTTKERRRSRRGLGILAGVGGGLLLLGGTTFALWNATAEVEGGTIQTGNLDVQPVGDPAYWDTSADRSDAAGTTLVSGVAAHAIPDLTLYSIVPGDTLEAEYGFAVALDGDNLVASVDLTLAGGTTPPDGVTFTAQAYYLDGADWTAVGTASPVTPGAATSIALGLFQAANQEAGTVDAGAIPVIELVEVPAVGAVANIAIVVAATFDETIDERTSTLAEAALGDVTVDLVQTRGPGVGNFP